MGIGRTTSLSRMADLALTYPEIGATQRAELPEGYQHIERREVVGSGREDFERAAAAVFDWQAQRGSGLRVRATGPASQVGSLVLLTIGLPRLGLDIPCRVVWVVQQPDRRGFGYGTLPGHPESGEESFVVSLEPSGEVVFTMRAFARMASRLAKLGGPVSTHVPPLALGLYTRAIRRAAAGR
ncbi:DUF1990 family protein [Modestobacter sp. I12A-02628]|uniref:DUF1990 domain-containing protein n=1 Tax=Goekera deserti TaxID=2497753 RepID=A0A7K3WF58_9ACTN|nr:DUF1990 domain-containing protein [Goekera deserti]MPQ98564.1 DUF1990 family protein [Goekera deserti]NDI49066.1 DUF1990 family protein [Goekera deserti]NEL54143.1 DUF1990 domain-containing protein [Goekera deserti]